MRRQGIDMCIDLSRRPRPHNFLCISRRTVFRTHGALRRWRWLWSLPSHKVKEKNVSRFGRGDEG